MSVTEQQVVNLLENVLFQSSSQAAANAGSWLGLPGVSTLSGLAAAMAASPEESIAAHVVGYYLSALGRAPTATEIRYYVGVAEQGLTQTQIAAGQVASSTWDTIASYFTQSPEFTARAGLDMSLGETAALFEAVPWLYQSVLGRAPSGFEISYYDNQIAAGGGLDTLFREFTASPEFATDTSGQIAAALAAYGTAVASGQDPATIGGTIILGPPVPTPSPAPTPTPTALTTGTDTFTTTDSSLTFTGTLGGVAPTLTPNDSLHGNANSFAITDTSGATSQDLIPTGVSLTGISAVTLTTSGNAGTDANHPFDLSGITGLTSFTLESSGIQGDFINAGSATSVSITTHGIGDMVAITSNSLVTLSLSGTLAGVTLTDAAGGTALTVDVTGVSLTGGFTDASDHLTSLTIAASGAASSIASLSDSALASLSLSGDVTLGSAGAPIVLGTDSFAVSGSGDDGSASLEFLLTGTQGGAGGNINSGGGTILLGDGTDKFTDHGVGGSGDNGDSVTTGSSGAIGGDGGSGGAAGQETVTFGNGTDTLVIDSTGGNGGDGGSTTVTGGGGGDISGNGGRGGEGGHDTLTLGNGNNTVADNSQGGNGGNGGAAQATGGGGASGGNGGSGGDGGHDTLTLGNGNNTVTDHSQGGNGGNGGAGQAPGSGSTGGNGGSGGDGGHNTIAVGNGNNIITDDSLGGTGGAAGSAEFSGSAGASGSGGNDVITVGTGTNIIDLGHHGNDTVILGTDAGFASTPTTANQTIENAASGDRIGFFLDGSGLTIQTPSLSTTNTATLLTDLEAAVTGLAKTAVFGTDGTNSYVVENHGLTLGADTTVIVEILGVHTVNSGTANFVELTS